MQAIAWVRFVQVSGFDLPARGFKHLGGVLFHILIDVHLRLFNFDLLWLLFSKLISPVPIQKHHSSHVQHKLETEHSQAQLEVSFEAKGKWNLDLFHVRRYLNEVVGYNLEVGQVKSKHWVDHIEESDYELDHCPRLCYAPKYNHHNHWDYCAENQLDKNIPLDSFILGFEKVRYQVRQSNYAKAETKHNGNELSEVLVKSTKLDGKNEKGEQRCRH